MWLMVHTTSRVSLRDLDDGSAVKACAPIAAGTPRAVRANLFFAFHAIPHGAQTFEPLQRIIHLQHMLLLQEFDGQQLRQTAADP